MTSPDRGLVYDAPSILGLGEASSDPLPVAAPGEVVLRVGAWSLRDLRTCDVVVRGKLMNPNPWYDQYAWANVPLTPGLYRLRVPIPSSNGKTFSEQSALLLPGEVVAPAALAVSALVCHVMVTGKTPLYGWVRCAETTLPGESRVELYVGEGRMRVDRDWGDGRVGNVGFAGCRMC